MKRYTYDDDEPRENFEVPLEDHPNKRRWSLTTNCGLEAKNIMMYSPGGGHGGLWVSTSEARDLAKALLKAAEVTERRADEVKAWSEERRRREDTIRKRIEIDEDA